MSSRVAIIYNKPIAGRYQETNEISAVLGILDAVGAVQKSLVELGHETILVPLELPIDKAKDAVKELDVEIVFNLFEGFPGYPETEAWLPELLQELSIPYTGCPAESLKIALNKAKTKELFFTNGIPTPPFQVLDQQTISNFRLSFPCIVKPLTEDASHGLNEQSVVHDMTHLESQVKFVCGKYGSALVEQYIEGREFNITVIGNKEYRVLPISEICYNLPPDKPRILTYAAKWEEDSLYYKSTPVICPAIISDEKEQEMREIAVAAYKITGCRGYARIDMRMDMENNINVLEVNPNPDISPNAGSVRQAKAAGLSYADFVKEILSLAKEIAVL